MKFLLLLSFILLFYNISQGQFATIEDDAKKVLRWEESANWKGAPLDGQPGGTLPNVDADSKSITINGYVTREGNLTLLNDGNDPGQNFTVEDTLIVYGNVDFQNNSLDLVVNGVMIVFGNLAINNQIDVGNSGTLVVDGNFTFSGGQGDYTLPSSGRLFVLPPGTMGGNGAPPSSENRNINELDGGDSADQELFNFVADGGNNGPLPVDLLFFDAFKENSRTVTLSWATASEDNFDYFVIERSLDGVHFDLVSTISGQGNTTIRHDYAFLDPSPYTGLNYYRLTSVDYDGSTEVFPLVAIQLNQELRPEIFPNPSSGVELNFRGLDALNPYDVEIISLDGKQHYSEKSVLGNILRLDTPLSTGLYVVKTTVGQQHFSQRLIVK